MALDVITNPQAILNVYEDISVVDKGFFHALELSPNDPKVTLTIRVQSAPARKPARWRKCDNTLIEMQILNIHSILLTDWHPETAASIKIVRREDNLISIKAVDGSLEIVCEYIYVSRLHPF